MATEEEVAAANAEADAQEAFAASKAEEAAAKIKVMEDSLERAKPRADDIDALKRKLEQVEQNIAAREQGERDAALVKHVRESMHYEGTLDNVDLLASLRRAGADLATPEGRAKLEAFRDKHARDFRVRGISHEQMSADLATTLSQNHKLKNNPFFSIERAMRSIGRKS